MEGSTFKRNVIDRVPVWIRLVDVPHSYWFREGLSLLAKAVGKPLKFDEATTRLEPLKYANIQVELHYSSPRPEHVWAKVINSLGIEEKEKIAIQYSQLPYSCSLCKAFGHSLSRCINNPDAVKRQPPKRGGQGTQSTTRNDDKQTNASTDDNKNVQDSEDEQYRENYVHNRELVPYTIGRLFDCPVVMDDDEILANAQQDHNHVHNDDNLDEYDVIPLNMNRELIPIDVPEELHAETNALPLANTFQSLTNIGEADEGVIEIYTLTKRKRNKVKTTQSPDNHPSAGNLATHILYILTL